MARCSLISELSSCQRSSIVRGCNTPPPLRGRVARATQCGPGRLCILHTRETELGPGTLCIAHAVHTIPHRISYLSLTAPPRCARNTTRGWTTLHNTRARNTTRACSTLHDTHVTPHSARRTLCLSRAVVRPVSGTSKPHCNSPHAPETP